jgi:hypothetical protein
MAQQTPTISQLTRLYPTKKIGNHILTSKQRSSQVHTYLIQENRQPHTNKQAKIDLERIEKRRPAPN